MKNIFIGILLSAGILSCQEEVTIGTHVDETFYIDNQGEAMKVTMRGNTTSKVVMLVVHGGPGGSASEYPMPPSITDKFAVAFWDQRVAGSSQGANVASSITIDTYITDLKKVILTIKHRYGQDQEIFLFGHSWGGFLTSAFLTTDQNQKMIKGWIYCEGAHNFPMLDSLVKAKLLETGNTQIAANKNVSTWQPIVNYCNSLPSENITTEQSLKLNDYATTAEEVMLKGVPSEAEQYKHGAPPVAFLSYFFNSNNSLNIDLYKDLHEVELSSKLSQVTVPVLVVTAKYDFTTPSGLGDDVILKIGSTVKTQLYLENSGHNVQEWNKCIDMVIKFIGENQ